MQCKRRRQRFWWSVAGTTVLVAAIAVSLVVLAGGDDGRFTATSYADVIRFEAEGVASLQVRIFDLSGKELWDSGVVSSWVVDWDRNNDFGERLAYGAYIYSAQGWNAQGDLIFQKNGKLALMPGDKVQLQAAPAVGPSEEEAPLPLPSLQSTFQPKGLGDVGIYGQIGIGTTSPDRPLHLARDGYDVYIKVESLGTRQPAGLEVKNSVNLWRWYVDSSGLFRLGDCTNSKYPFAIEATTPNYTLHLDSTGNVGIGTTSPDRPLHLARDGDDVYIKVESLGTGQPAGLEVKNSVNLWRWYVDSSGLFRLGDRTNSKYPFAIETATPNYTLHLDSTGNVGIGTTNPTAKLTIEDSSGQDLIVAYNSSNRVFVVKNNGEVRADGAYYGASFNTVSGAADVAERINVSEWVEAGCVMEIDPDHPGFFRKSSSLYSTKVAGIISTSPGVILGNSFDEATDDWEDNRPMLALAGRVLVKVTAENGPIQIGDLLVSSSTRGFAMKGSDRGACVGAVIGKAMEPLEEGTGVIMVQVMLR